MSAKADNRFTEDPDFNPGGAKDMPMVSAYCEYMPTFCVFIGILLGYADTIGISLKVYLAGQQVEERLIQIVNVASRRNR